MYKIVPAERQECSGKTITKNRCKPSKNGLQRSFLAPPAGFEPVACRLGGDRSIQLSYGGIYRKYSILQGSRIRTIRFLGGDRSIQLSYGGLCNKYSILQGSRIRTIRFLGGDRSIQLSYRDGCAHQRSILYPFSVRLSMKKAAAFATASKYAYSMTRTRMMLGRHLTSSTTDSSMRAPRSTMA